MDDVKLPDIEKLRAVKQRLKKLPPQKSATDTSNWENRMVSAVTFDAETKKHTVRKVDFMIAEEKPLGIPYEQAQRLILAARGFTPEQIEQILLVDKNLTTGSK